MTQFQIMALGLHYVKNPCINRTAIVFAPHHNVIQNKTTTINADCNSYCYHAPYDTYSKYSHQLNLKQLTLQQVILTQNKNHSIKQKANIPAVPNSIRLHSLALSFEASFALTNDSISARVLSF